jgi:hypothetical protein
VATSGGSEVAPGKGRNQGGSWKWSVEAFQHVPACSILPLFIPCSYLVHRFQSFSAVFAGSLSPKLSLIQFASKFSIQFSIFWELLFSMKKDVLFRSRQQRAMVTKLIASQALSLATWPTVTMLRQGLLYREAGGHRLRISEDIPSANWNGSWIRWTPKLTFFDPGPVPFNLQIESRLNLIDHIHPYTESKI